jgi:hypothetical protein
MLSWPARLNATQELFNGVVVVIMVSVVTANLVLTANNPPERLMSSCRAGNDNANEVSGEQKKGRPSLNTLSNI